MLKAANNYAMHGIGTVEDMRDEAIQTAAMAIRFLANLDAVERQRINESVRQELHEEHGLNYHIWKSEEQADYLADLRRTGGIETDKEFARFRDAVAEVRSDEPATLADWKEGAGL